MTNAHTDTTLTTATSTKYSLIRQRPWFLRAHGIAAVNATHGQSFHSIHFHSIHEHRIHCLAHINVRLGRISPHTIQLFGVAKNLSLNSHSNVAKLAYVFDCGIPMLNVRVCVIRTYGYVFWMPTQFAVSVLFSALSSLRLGLHDPLQIPSISLHTLFTISMFRERTTRKSTLSTTDNAPAGIRSQFWPIQNSPI